MYLTLTPKKIFELFFKFQKLQHIPIISGDKIYSFISKAKMLREASNTNFFDQNLNALLEKVFETAEPTQFFSQIDTLQLDKIPIISFKDWSIHELTVRKFNSIFRPLLALSNEQMRLLIDTFSLPLFVLNSRHEIIYQNKSVAKLQKFLAEEAGLKKKSITAYFPESFYQALKNEYPDKIYSLKTSNRVLRYKAQSLALHDETVTLVYFLN